MSWGGGVMLIEKCHFAKPLCKQIAENMNVNKQDGFWKILGLLIKDLSPLFRNIFPPLLQTATYSYTPLIPLSDNNNSSHWATNTWIKGRAMTPQCGNFRIFPLLITYFTWNQSWWFLRSKNCYFEAFRDSEYYQFGKFQPSKSAENHKNQHSEPLNVLKWRFLDLKITNFDFT